MTKKKRRKPERIYDGLSAKLRDQLVRCLDGHWYKIKYVDGLSTSAIHVHTVEGHAFWAEKDQDGRYYEIGPD